MKRLWLNEKLLNWETNQTPSLSSLLSPSQKVPEKKRFAENSVVVRFIIESKIILVLSLASLSFHLCWNITKWKLLSGVWLFMTLWELPSSSVRGILQARIPEWVAIPFSRESFWPRDQTLVSCIGGRFFLLSEPPGKPEDSKGPFRHYGAQL